VLIATPDRAGDRQPMYAWLWTLEQSLLHYWNVQGKGRKPLAYVSPRPASNLGKNSHITNTAWVFRFHFGVGGQLLWQCSFANLAS
jgi:hypothetical protein